MRRPSRTGLSWLIVLAANLSVTAQNLEAIGREKPLSVTGGISFNQIFYATDGAASRREPYTWFASGNVNLSLYGWSIPFSFGFGKYRTTFSQPFNRYAIHPTWKRVTLHAGYTSMSFSPYTVNGHVFRGAGLEIAPVGRWTISALCGRFLKAVPADTTSSASRQPAYQRTGYGIKVRYGGDDRSADIILFRASDDKSSITPPPDSLQVTPQENLVASVGASGKAFKHLVVRSEMAVSALTHDTRSEKSRANHILARAPALFQPRLSSRYFRAWKSSIDYQQQSWLAGVGYERIDPGYRTLGAYYFNNDLENVNVHTSVTGHGKITVAASAGIQRDNLDGAKFTRMRRIVSALNINFVPSPRLNLSTSWSSFQSFTNVRSPLETLSQPTPYDRLDTLDFTQIARNAAASALYTMGDTEEHRQSFSINVSWQKAADRQGDFKRFTGTSFYNINAGYSIAFPRTATVLAIAFNSAINNGPLADTRIHGPMASITRSMLNKKLRTTLTSSWNKTAGERAATILNGRLNGVYSLRNKHNLALVATVVSRQSEASRVTELTVTAGYSYSFSTNAQTHQRKSHGND